jgi:MbtH protein
MNYQVVVNGEGQHALWPAGRELPAGWRAAGFEGTEQECVHYVDEVWTDIRPLSVQSPPPIGER